MAWDGSSRIYVWDTKNKYLHRILVRLGEPEPSSILAASPSKILRADVPLRFEVKKIIINGAGSALLLTGSEGVYVMYLYGHSSAEENTVICQTIPIASNTYFDTNNFVRILKVSWHPYSDTHVGLLSSDNVFRLYNLSTSYDHPEQEYYLQPVEPGYSVNAAAICPVDFSFGGDHLWDKFSVFILFSNGSVYVMCPIIPFGSVYKRESILELYTDVHTFGLKSDNSKAVNNSNMSITWMEATFPELVPQTGDSVKSYAVKAHPFVLLDASVSLQGPLHQVYQGTTQDSEVQRGICEGRAVSFLYNLVGKDSILARAWSSGQLQLDALADEIQPIWKMDSAPRVSVDSSNQMIGVAMICEQAPNNERPVLNLNDQTHHAVWSGHAPPLLRLAIVDLALPNKVASSIDLFIDPLVPERLLCLHAGGVDSVVLHFLPFTSQTSGKEAQTRFPSVLSVLSTALPGDSSSPLSGFLALSDSFGYSWIVALTSSKECVVLQMETWNVLLNRAIEKEREDTDESEEPEDAAITPTIISKELLSGPKAMLLPSSAPNSRSVTAESIEGRSMLHQYSKLFHENYVEYAHKVHFELQHHAPQLKKIIENQHIRLREMQQKLVGIEQSHERIETRLDRAVELHSALEARLQRLRCLPLPQKKVLSKAERDFKLELDTFTGMELDALHASIEALSSRLKKHITSSNQTRHHKPGRTVNRRQEDELSQLRSSLAKLSLINSDNAKKVKIVESALRDREISD